MKQFKVKYKHTDPMVVLVGPMGVGKSTIGRQLAQKMKLDFIDIDEEIENISGVTISEIFDSVGEDEFRRIESKVLNDNCCASGTVVATGGGAILSAYNRAIMRHGLVVYLHATPKQQLDRISNRYSRPLLKNADNPLKKLSELMTVRDPLYRSEADIIIRTDHMSRNAIVEDLEEKLLLL